MMPVYGQQTAAELDSIRPKLPAFKPFDLLPGEKAAEDARNHFRYALVILFNYYYYLFEWRQPPPRTPFTAGSSYSFYSGVGYS
jgi:hypothetical protein